MGLIYVNQLVKLPESSFRTAFCVVHGGIKEGTVEFGTAIGKIGMRKNN
jgi:hypothetical protein